MSKNLILTVRPLDIWQPEDQPRIVDIEERDQDDFRIELSPKAYEEFSKAIMDEANRFGVTILKK